MSIKGDLREWDVDIHALQHFTSVPPDDPNGALYVDGEPYGSGGGGGSDGAPHTIQDAGVDVTQRANLNIAGSGVAVTDDAINDATVVTITVPDAYTHPNHTGDVTSAGDGATTIADDAVTNAKLANMPSATLKGSIAGGSPADLTKTEVLTLLNVTDGAEANTVDSVNTKTGAVVLDSDDISDTGKTHKFATAAQLAEIAANTAKVTNATHTGEVTGSGALALDATAITNRTAVTPVGADHVLIYDASGTVLAKALVSALPMTRVVSIVGYSASYTPDVSTAYNGIIRLTMTGSPTINAPTGSPTNGQTIEFWLIQIGRASCRERVSSPV